MGYIHVGSFGDIVGYVPGSFPVPSFPVLDPSPLYGNPWEWRGIAHAHSVLYRQASETSLLQHSSASDFGVENLD